MTASVPNVFFFTALHCEAKPLIRQYGLKKLQQPHPFAIYGDKELVLTVSGVGKAAMAGAVAYTMALFRPKLPLLLNIGIAGHQDIPSGNLLLADKIVDADDVDKRFYPHLIGRFSCPTRPLCTVSRPDFEYRDDYLYDMEGVAFYEMAVKFSSGELIHCLKIISDNRHEAATHVNARQVTTWVCSKTQEMVLIINRLEQLRRELSEQEPPLYRSLLERYRFSVSNRIRLKVLLNRWEVVSGNEPLEIEKSFLNGKQFMNWLEAKIDEQEFYL